MGQACCAARPHGHPALQNDFELVARCHDRSSADGKSAIRLARPVVHAEHGIDGKAREQPFLDHLARTTAAFLGRLEDEVHRAVKIAMLGQVLRCRQQHGGVAIMAAGMHFPGVATGMGKGVELLHRQGIHVGPQANGAR